MYIFFLWKNIICAMCRRLTDKDRKRRWELTEYMQIRARYRHVLIVVFVLNIIAIMFFLYFYMKNKIPNEINLIVSREEDFDFNVPMYAKIESEDMDVISVNQEKISLDEIELDLNQPFTLASTSTGEYTVDVKLFGIFPIKKLSLSVIDSVEVIPCGNPIGIYVQTDGILVLGNGKIKGEDGITYEPSLNKLKSGDYILAVNGVSVPDKNHLMEQIECCNGKNLDLTIRRNHNEFDVSIQPVKTAESGYKIGAWIRDDTQGIGTLTFVTTNGYFGALGHGITDIDTGLLMEIKEGDLYRADIMSIIKGKEGEPGELIGVIRQNIQNRMGDIRMNTNQGIFGKVSSGYHGFEGATTLPIGLKQDVKKGKASILCFVDHDIQEYEIEILDVDMSNTNHNKGMVIKITDSDLLEKTGGIVQGMSGSPIIQNNKLIGAVTHVFIQDSTKGYGTFIENMLNKLE